MPIAYTVVNYGKEYRIFKVLIICIVYIGSLLRSHQPPLMPAGTC